jgi:RimJ/RimL family protein N-acetyltransferase
MRIEGRRVHLEPFAERHLHAPRYLAWLRDREVMRYIGRDEYFKPFEFSMVEDYVRSLWANPLCAFWAVHALDDGAFVGTFKTNYGDEAGRATRSTDIGIMIGDRSRWGRGYATDALAAGCAHAFDTLGARKLTAGANAANAGVLRAFRKIGFVEEGRLRRKLLVDDAYHDHVLLGCFADELARPT